VDVFLGTAHFCGPDTVEVQGKRLCFKKAVTPRCPGSAIKHSRFEEGYLTNETVFSLNERPRRLAVIGGGYIGCELAQTFQRLGSEVVLLHKNAHILIARTPTRQKLFNRRLYEKASNSSCNANSKRLSVEML